MIRALAAMLGLAALPAVAQDWRAQVTPYVWASGLGGDLRPYAAGPTLSFDKSLSDVLEDLDHAFFLSGYARRDRLVLLGDLSWSSSSREGDLRPGLPAEGKLTQRSITLAAGWRALDGPDMTLDLLGGARAWRITAEVSAAGGAMGATARESFVDPILVARANFTLSPRWSAIVYLDAGGFGVGSDRTTQAFVTANYRVNDRLYVSAGYRRLDFDHDGDGTRLDVMMAGPLLGVTWRF